MPKTLKLNPATKIVEELMYAPLPNWLPIDLSAVDTASLSKLELAGCQLTLVCGVSTAGKSTLVKAALKQTSNPHYLPRATSRPPRPGEKEGQDYFFDVSDPLIWSEFGGNIYAITDHVIQQLAKDRNCLRVQGLLYGFVLQHLLAPFGVKVKIVYLLPETRQKNLLGSLRVCLDRLDRLHPREFDARLPSIVRELRFVFDHYQELKKRGVIFLENPPTGTYPTPELIQKLSNIAQA